MIAHCPHCGTIFTTDKLRGSNVNEVVIKGFDIDCPKCGKVASIVDGTYNFDPQGVITFLTGPAYSIEILQKLRKLTGEAKEKGFGTDEFKIKAEQITADIKGLWKYVPVEERKIAFYSLLFDIIGLLINLFGQPAPQIINTYQVTNNNQQYINYNIGPASNPSQEKRGSNYTAPKAKRKKVQKPNKKRGKG